MTENYEAAWKDFVRRFGGAYDGTAHAAERGSTDASRDIRVYDSVGDIVDEVAEEHGVEGVWEL